LLGDHERVTPEKSSAILKTQKKGRLRTRDCVTMQEGHERLWRSRSATNYVREGVKNFFDGHTSLKKRVKWEERSNKFLLNRGTKG